MSGARKAPGPVVQVTEHFLLVVVAVEVEVLLGLRGEGHDPDPDLVPADVPSLDEAAGEVHQLRVLGFCHAARHVQHEHDVRLPTALRDG